ncbi:hypothetical protein HRbin29_00985 [bacterium HR29]|jgi:MFS family permease|nr:hypothetical protein HRbin29_00985 [bacterium HR29]
MADLSRETDRALFGRHEAAAAASEPAGRFAAFSVFRNRDYRYLWVSSALSFLGMQMQQVGRGLLAWELTHSFTAVGAISLSFGLPMLLFSLVGGAIADRVNKRNLSLATQLVTVALAVLTAVLVATDLITIGYLFAVGLVQGTMFAFNGPARSPLMAMVVGPRQLMSAIAMSNAAMNGTRIVGPAVAGALAAQGLDAVFWGQAAVYAGAALALTGVPASRGEPMPLGPGVRRPAVGRQIVDGVRYVAREPSLRQLMLLAFVPTLFGMPYVMLMPGFVQRDLGQSEAAYGFLLTVSGIGALAGSLTLALLADFRRKPLLQFVTGLASGVSLAALAAAAAAFGYPGALGTTVVIGFTFTVYQTLNNTMVMNTAAPEYYGRVMSIYMLTFSAMPLMAAPLGALADVVGASALFVVQGCLVAGGVLAIGLANPRFTFGDAPPSGRAGVPHAGARLSMPPGA